MFNLSIKQMKIAFVLFLLFVVVVIAAQIYLNSVDIMDQLFGQGDSLLEKITEPMH